ncbi:hypothetical protein NP233_g8032 [Leucocoprinus birnbaumii]|uniref:Peroxisome membrane anchor protein Pex14p N-terminal domain-containing protein n=1 Tax=Leucocoprinus birnbaumii TaxID=56174 RepID=A0AAD5VN67_9AGAR|nr:hypothetical protein NP233_g8032 [Leucocoprinus birnbaumii]
MANDNDPVNDSGASSTNGQRESSLVQIPSTLSGAFTEETSHSKSSGEADRSLLLSRARDFLHSPHISGQDLFSKRRFLREKGLHEVEIDVLLRDAPTSAPLIPPRTYPQPAPSNLPNLLLGLSRIFSWLAGGSAILIFIYYRFFLPRIASSFMARHSLKNHHLTLMRRLTTSLSAFKETQAEAWSVLPKADPWRELTPYSKCASTDDISVSYGDQEIHLDTVSPVTVLRCGLADLTKGEENQQKPTTEELFRYLEEKFTWLLSPDGLKYEQRLWETLSTCPLFSADPPFTLAASQDPQPPSRWSYAPPLPPDPSLVVKALSSLKLALPKNSLSKPSVFQSTLQAVSEFTGYISTQVYTPYRAPSNGVGIASNLTVVEEQLRREIRALKGLVLNRTTFQKTASAARLCNLRERKQTTCTISETVPLRSKYRELNMEKGAVTVKLVDDVQRNAIANTIGSLNITFLGTASAQPSTTRNHSSLALRLGADVWLFDCGEATQHQIQKSDSVRMGRIKKIFITHTHGDHIFGICPLLASCMNGAGGTTEGNEDPRTLTKSIHPPPVEIYGPIGTRAYIRNALSLTHTNLDGTYVVHELRFPTDPQQGDCTALSQCPYELEGRNIPQFKGLWENIYSDAVVSVSAAPIHHSVPCVGYVVAESPIPGKIEPKNYLPDIKRTNTPMSVMRQLQQGLSVELSDGTVLHGPPRRRGRKLVILGDTYDPSPITPLASDADLLIHEATNAHLPKIDPNTKTTDTYELVEERAKSRGHSTPQMAGAFAKHIRARKLVLNHFSSRYPGDDSESSRTIMDAIGRLAAEKYGKEVACARDFMSFDVVHSNQ